MIPSAEFSSSFSVPSCFFIYLKISRSGQVQRVFLPAKSITPSLSDQRRKADVKVTRINKSLHRFQSHCQSKCEKQRIRWRENPTENAETLIKCHHFLRTTAVIFIRRVWNNNVTRRRGCSAEAVTWSLVTNLAPERWHQGRILLQLVFWQGWMERERESLVYMLLLGRLDALLFHHKWESFA